MFIWNDLDLGLLEVHSWERRKDIKQVPTDPM